MQNNEISKKINELLNKCIEYKEKKTFNGLMSLLKRLITIEKDIGKENSKLYLKTKQLILKDVESYEKVIGKENSKLYLKTKQLILKDVKSYIDVFWGDIADLHKGTKNVLNYLDYIKKFLEILDIKNNEDILNRFGIYGNVYGFPDSIKVIDENKDNQLETIIRDLESKSDSFTRSIKTGKSLEGVLSTLCTVTYNIENIKKGFNQDQKKKLDKAFKDYIAVHWNVVKRQIANEVNTLKSGKCKEKSLDTLKGKLKKLKELLTTMEEEEVKSSYQTRLKKYVEQIIDKLDGVTNSTIYGSLEFFIKNYGETFPYPKHSEEELGIVIDYYEQYDAQQEYDEITEDKDLLCSLLLTDKNIEILVFTEEGRDKLLRAIEKTDTKIEKMRDIVDLLKDEEWTVQQFSKAKKIIDKLQNNKDELVSIFVKQLRSRIKNQKYLEELVELQNLKKKIEKNKDLLNSSLYREAIKLLGKIEATDLSEQLIDPTNQIDYANTLNTLNTLKEKCKEYEEKNLPELNLKRANESKSNKTTNNDKQIKTKNAQNTKAKSINLSKEAKKLIIEHKYLLESEWRNDNMYRSGKKLFGLLKNKLPEKYNHILQTLEKKITQYKNQKKLNGTTYETILTSVSPYPLLTNIITELKKNKLIKEVNSSELEKHLNKIKKEKWDQPEITHFKKDIQILKKLNIRNVMKEVYKEIKINNNYDAETSVEETSIGPMIAEIISPWIKEILSAIFTSLCTCKRLNAINGVEPIKRSKTLDGSIKTTKKDSMISEIINFFRKPKQKK